MKPKWTIHWIGALTNIILVDGILYPSYSEAISEVRRLQNKYGLKAWTEMVVNR